MTIEIEDYFQTMLKHLGDDLWQQKYIDTPSNISSFYLTEQSLIASSTINYKMLIEANRKKLKIRNKPKYQPGASANLLMKCQETLGVPLPNELLIFYSQTNGMHLQWNKKELSGCIQLLPIDATISGQASSIYNYYPWATSNNHQETIGYIDEEDATYQLSQELCILEDFEGDSGFLGFWVNPQKKIELYYRLSRGTITPLNLSLVDYLHIHLELLGYWCWVELKEQGALDSLPEHQSLVKVFPDFDFDKLNPI